MWQPYDAIEGSARWHRPSREMRKPLSAQCIIFEIGHLGCYCPNLVLMSQPAAASVTVIVWRHLVLEFGDEI